MPPTLETQSPVMITNTVATECQIRRPKAEARRQSEIRSPKHTLLRRAAANRRGGLGRTSEFGLRTSHPARLLAFVALVLLPFSAALAVPALGPWTPIFKGIDHAVGTNNPSIPGSFPELQVVHCVRVDLTDPDVQIFATPRASSYVAESRETLTLSVPDFLKQYKLQVAADANFYNANPGGADPSSEGVPCEVYGLQISTGIVVSA